MQMLKLDQYAQQRRISRFYLTFALHVDEGEVVALVGSNGAVKPRSCAPNPGEVKTQSCSTQWYRRRSGGKSALFPERKWEFPTSRRAGDLGKPFNQRQPDFGFLYQTDKRRRNELLKMSMKRFRF
jgi:hypothetical protein